MCVGCDTKLKKSVGRKKLVSDEVVTNAFSRCLRRIAVDDILCNKCWLSIYRNNSDKDSDCETETNLSPSHATSNDLTFEVKVKSKEAFSETDVDNTLATEAEEKGWIRRKTPFKIVTADGILDFSEMSERGLTLFFTGSYQLSQAVSYSAVMLDKDGKLTLEYVKKKYVQSTTPTHFSIII